MYKELFNQLDKYLDEHRPTPPIKIIKPCCDNKRVRCGDIDMVCVNCGRIYELDEIVIKQQFLNPKYQLSTTIGYAAKTRSIHRLHKWINYDYRENMANRNYVEIRDMGNKLNLNIKVLNNACYIYKRIYIDNNVSSRNKIKRSLYVYCLFRSCVDYKLDFNIIQTLKDNKLTIENYNKALNKVIDDDKLYLNPNMERQYKKIIDNWTTDITIKDVIVEYNRICKLSKENKYKLNNNSILIGSIYKLLDIKDNDKKFYKVFNITSTTIKKFAKILN